MRDLLMSLPFAFSRTMLCDYRPSVQLKPMELATLLHLILFPVLFTAITASIPSNRTFSHGAAALHWSLARMLYVMFPSTGPAWGMRYQ